ncbi:metallophosphoesterase family protein [Hyphococcus sp.]|uniref:metallophosphoesterase family protein n=1 Tax=Hyphococcus sp. TaxID=2038636 RepID=UPI003CCBF396
MTVLAHISDIHFGSVDPQAAESLADQINSANVDGIIVTGDLTQAGRKSEFGQAGAYLRAFQAPVLVVPGNHDTPVYNLTRRFIDPWGRFRDHIHSNLSPELNINDVYVVGLNSARRANLTLDWSLGRLSSRQLDEASRKLRQAEKNALKLVAFHHPVLPGPGRAGMAVIKRPARAISSFASAGADALLTGHAHIARADLHETGERSIIITAAGTATSTRTRGEAPSYNLLSWNGAELSIAIHRYTSRGYEKEAVKSFLRKDETWNTAENT